MAERNTKIICTMGPSINNEEMLIKMFNAGMNVARINFSHGTHESAAEQINMIRSASKKAEKYIGIMLDTKGPEIRTGIFENGAVEYKQGDIVKLVKNETICNKEQIYITCKELFNDVKKGDKLLVDDGKITLKILSVNENEITVEFLNDGTISNKKGINAPGIDLTMPFISEKDYEDIKFGCEQGIDLIALSFVRTADDVLQVREILKECGNTNIEIISKIESQQGIDNLKEIIKVSDGIMVARGDLGVEVATELVPLYQKKIIKMANSYGKPVVTATHMLESMIVNPRPTRAEASDIANAILDGTSAIMLSGESAIGKYPIQSVSYMDKIAKIAESMIDHKDLLIEARDKLTTKNDVISISAVEASLNFKDVKAIFAFTETGGTVKRICKFRPKVPVIACTDNLKTCYKLAHYWGVHAVSANYVDDMSMCDEIANKVAEEIGLKQGDHIVIVAGFGEEHGITNTLRIIQVK